MAKCTQVRNTYYKAAWSRSFIRTHPGIAEIYILSRSTPRVDSLHYILSERVLLSQQWEGSLLGKRGSRSNEFWVHLLILYQGYITSTFCLICAWLHIFLPSNLCLDPEGNSYTCKNCTLYQAHIPTSYVALFIFRHCYMGEDHFKSPPHILTSP